VVLGRFNTYPFMAKTIYTIGHSNKTLPVFLKTLKKHGIQVLVDVRTIPLSRFYPHFNRNALQSALEKRDIQYLWRGQNLGGRGVNVGYEDAIDEVVRMAKGKRVCVMCSEGDYHKCHRLTMLAPSFEERGLEVVHTVYEKSTGNK